jgi:hypothetical protein
LMQGVWVEMLWTYYYLFVNVEMQHSSLMQIISQLRTGLRNLRSAFVQV